MMSEGNRRESGETRTGRLLVIVGPTAVGKTTLSLSLAARFEAVVISADSRQIYRGMDIGTAKPTFAERALVPHRLLDIVDPDEPFSLADYVARARVAINEASREGHLPLLVGGTGQYVRAITEGWGIPRVPPQPILRALLEREAQQAGGEALHRRLVEIDHEAALRIDPRNVRRVIRALEVFFVTGKPISHLQRKTPPPYCILQIGLRRDRAELYQRIDARVDMMIRVGLLEEVRRLTEEGFHDQLPSMSGLGYRQLCAAIRGEMSLEEAVARIKRDTRRFVHQQTTWFREDDPQIEWYHADDVALIERRLTEWLSEDRGIV